MGKEVRLDIEVLRELAEGKESRVCIGRITDNPYDPCQEISMCSYMEICRAIAKQLEED